MGWGVSHHQPDVAPELGALDPVFRLPSRHSQGDLYYQRGRVVEYELAQGDQNQGIVPQPGSRYETAVSGSGAHRQEVDYAGAELEGRLAALLDSARRPRTESRVGVNRHSMKNRKKNISGMGALPPNPRDLSLSRQDSWTGRRAAARHLGIPAPESALGLRLRRALPSAQVRSVYQGRVYKSLAVYTKNLTRPTSRIQLHPSSECCRGWAPCVGAAEKTERHCKRTSRPLDKPSAASRNRSNSTTLATRDSGDPVPRSTVPRAKAPAHLPLSAATWKCSSSTDSPRDTRDHSSACDVVRSCIPENRTALSVPASRWSSPRSA